MLRKLRELSLEKQLFLCFFFDVGVSGPSFFECGSVL